MDDINLIRAVMLDEGEDGEQGRATGRLRLQQAVAAERASRVPVKRRPWLTLAGGALVAAAAAVALVIGLGAHPDAAPPPPVKAPQTAQEFLLAAATRAADAPATTGKYWHTRWDMHYSLSISVAAPGNPPAKPGPEASAVTEQWLAANPGDPSWSSFVRVSDGVYRPEVKKADLIGYGWETEFKQAEVVALPTDPAALRNALTAKNNQLSQDLPPLDEYLFEATIRLLASAPESPAQLAAGYGLLASLPGVELAGTATDSEGRAGVLLRHQSGSDTDEVIVDRETYQVLAVKSAAKIGTEQRTSQIVFKTREWTDTEPTR